jgi:hypothetical protein
MGVDGATVEGKDPSVFFSTWPDAAFLAEEFDLEEFDLEEFGLATESRWRDGFIF